MSYWMICALYILGAWWCYEVIARWRDDVKELREVKEITRKAVIIIVWGITIVIAILLVRFTFRSVATTISELAWR